MSTAQRINNLFENSGKSKRSILMELNFSPTALAEWNRGKSKPTLDAIVLLARYFNVSADYLLCLTDEMKPIESREVAQKSETELALFEKMPKLFEEQRFVDTAKIYSELPDEYRERIYGMVIGLAIGLGLNIDKILGDK